MSSMITRMAVKLVGGRAVHCIQTTIISDLHFLLNIYSLTSWGQAVPSKFRILMTNGTLLVACLIAK